MKNKKVISKIFLLLILFLFVLVYFVTDYTVKTITYEPRVVPSSITVTYTSGEGQGNDVVVQQDLLSSRTKGTNDYTDYKIIFARNNATTNVGTTNDVNNVTINFSHENDSNGYSYILTGWKLIEVVTNKNGTPEVHNEFVKPENENYVNPSDVNKDINRIYAQEGWYIVPNYVTSIVVEAVYGRAIYVRSPYDKMIYNEYHCFAYGENILPDSSVVRSESAPDDKKTQTVAVEKSSDSNTGKTPNDAVSTIKRVYQLIANNSSNTVYDNVVVLCGDLYEINRRSTGANYVIPGSKDGTYQNYSSGSFGYNSSTHKHMTVTSMNGTQKLYLCSNANDINLYSSLRLDNVTLEKITNGVEKLDLIDDKITVSTYQVAGRFGVQTLGNSLEITETTKSNLGTQFIWARKASKIIVNNGAWHLFANWAKTDTVNNEEAYFLVGGLSTFSRLCNSIGQDVVPTTPAYFTNPITINITGGKIVELYGTPQKENLNTKGDAYIFVSGGYIQNFYGGKEGSTFANGDEKGDINIITYGGIIDILYGAGQRYTSNISGDVNISLSNTTVNGNIYGAGKGGTVSSSINFTINNCIIKGEFFGAGQGLTDTISYIKQWSSAPVINGHAAAVTNYNKTAVSQNLPLWEEAPVGFPSYDAENAQINTRYIHSKTEAEGNINLFLNGSKASLTLSNVSGDVNVVINNSTLNKNVYGGGSISTVSGNVSLTLNNCQVGKDLYGGGDGVTNPGGVTLYKPIPQGSYSVISSKGEDKPISIGVFNWMNDVDILTYFKGIYDGENKVVYNDDGTTIPFSELSNEAQKLIAKYGNNKLIYSANIEKLGMIYGNVSLAVNDTVIKGIVYGGGNKGVVEGNTQVTVNGEAQITNIFAGSNQANIGGEARLIINSGTIVNAYGGNNLSGVITSALNTQINGGTITNVYGGGNEASTTLDTNVSVNGGEITSLYGGGNQANVNNSQIVITENISTPIIKNIYGGGYEGTVEGNASIILENGQIEENIYGGGYEGNIEGSTNITIENGKIKESIYGGGYQGAIYNNTEIIINNGSIKNIYGGGYLGNVIEGSQIQINEGTIENNVYGGGYQGNVTETNIQVNEGKIQNIYGGGYEGKVEEGTQIQINGGEIQNIYGGGYQGDIKNSDITLENGTIEGSVYGGGYQGEVLEEVIIRLKGSTINQSIYGGGYAGDIEGKTQIEVTKGEVNKNIYGGGYAGEVGQTLVYIKETEGQKGTIKIEGNVFGGGEGITATVHERTKVEISLNINQTVEEILVDTESITEVSSGESACRVEKEEGNSYIQGSVYGGGDLGQIGKGIIDTSNNTATISEEGRTEVKVENGYIGGSVFGGGNGIPESGTYQLKMGTVYGSTKVEINGGYIEENVYGGGKQSRIYFSNLNDASIKTATEVVIKEVEEEIVIKGSVFGGGDRGNSATTNASVPTTIGDVLVRIEGKEEGSKIYFLTGGVYGDGNLCLVKGVRTIELENFNTNAETLKTFRSLQRADKVILRNTDIVLLGAVDLVEEGDNTVYSINRVSVLRLEEGSTIKLDQIVKYLGQIESDYEFIESDDTETRKFIDKGNNGENGYSYYGQANPSPLTEEEIRKYQEEDNVSNLKNIICVANGLYLEIKNEENEYGKVVGLFTLQLLRANEGEGGGFVYASIKDSIGSFICETRYGNDKPYMNIIGNVSGLKDSKYTYYCWFIQGNTINYIIGITGYIGSDETSYEEESIIPTHIEKLYYVLNKITVNSELQNAIGASKYELVERKENLLNQEIALELYIGNESVGFLKYEGGKWYINNKEGYHSLIEHFEENTLKNVIVDNLNNNIEIVLHKSKEVNYETNNMQVEIEIDLITEIGSIYSEGTSKLKYKIGFSIVRLVPEQMLYTGNDKMYSGLSETEIIKITNGSSFTIEYQTRYIPIAFPSGASKMEWVLSTKGCSYYIDELGNFLTIDSEGQVINISPLLTIDPSEVGKILVRKNSNGEYEYTHDSRTIKFNLIAEFEETYLPKGTKITMIDMTLSSTPTYYYYICSGEEKEIKLENFYIMGTMETIKESGRIPEYEKQYNLQESSRVTERIIFVFDLEQVEESEYRNLVENVYEGKIVLRHNYMDVDMMDYVKSETNNDVTTFTRSTPKVATYQVNTKEDGVEVFDIEFEEKGYEKGEVAEIIINITQDDEYTNTQLKDGKIGIKIEVEGLGELPDGIEFLYNGTFLPKYGNKYLIIPVSTYGEHKVEIVNVLGTIETNEELKKAQYQGTLCYLPDEGYYNETVLTHNTIIDMDIECDIKEKQEKSIKVEIENKYITQGSREIEIKVYEKNTTEETILKVYYITDVAKEETRDIYLLSAIKGTENGKINILQLSSNIRKGTYELVFINGDKKEVVNIIIN